MPEEEEVKRGKWTFAHLPAIPSKFALKPIEKSEDRLKVLLKLLKRKDVHGARQRLRRRARGRTDLPLHRPVREDRQADPAAVAAVDDARVDPRRLRAPAHRRRDAAARRRRDLPLRVRLAGRHQRHARDDGVQLEVGRLPADDGGPRADADARDPGRARGEDPRVRAARLLGAARHVPRRRAASTRAAGSTRRSASPTTIPTPRAERLWDEAKARAIAGQLRRQARHRHRGIEADDAEPAAALRPDDAAARGQRPLRLLGAHARCRSRRRSTKSTRC